MYSQEGETGRRGKGGGGGGKMTCPFEGHIEEIIIGLKALLPSDSYQPLSFVSKIQHGSCTYSRWALHLHTLNKHLFLCGGILVHMSQRSKIWRLSILHYTPLVCQQPPALPNPTTTTTTAKPATKL